MFRKLTGVQRRRKCCCLLAVLLFISVVFTFTVSADDTSSGDVSSEILVSDLISSAPSLAPPAPDRQITSFSLPAQIRSTFLSDTEIEVVMPHGMELNALAPTIDYIGDSITPENRTIQDFTVPREYVVNTQGVGTEYRITARYVGIGNFITKFDIPGQIGSTEIDHERGEINLEMASGSNLSKLVPNFEISPLAQSTLIAGEALDCSSPVEITVTAEDTSTRNYILNVSMASPSFDMKVGNIWMLAGMDVFPNGAQLKVNQEEGGSPYYETLLSLVDEQTKAGRKLWFYDISVQNDGVDVQPDKGVGFVTLRFLLPDGVESNGIVLSRVVSDGQNIVMPGAVREYDGRVYYEVVVDSLTSYPWAFAAKIPDTPNPKPTQEPYNPDYPPTGDSTNMLLYIIMASIALVGCIWLVVIKKKSMRGKG